MNYRFFVAGFAGLLFLAAQTMTGQAPPDAEEQKSLIAEIREKAVKFDQNLPDFICSQITRRHSRVEPNVLTGVKSSGAGRAGSKAISGEAGNWQPMDSFEQQLSYFDHRERYALTKMNGKKIKNGEAPPPGLESAGEFGSTLTLIFDPLSKAEFEFKKFDTLRGRPVYVFVYRIARENSASELRAATRRLTVGYHGLIYADRDDKSVSRVTTEAEPPKDFPLQNVTHVLDYGETTIGGTRFLLPLQGDMESTMSEDFMQYGRPGGNSRQVTLRNEVSFVAYRKYSAEATLKPE